MFTYFYELFFYEKNTAITNPYLREFYSGYASWKENFFIGGGINSFYLNCKKTITYCANHPHNYYLEILSEIGLIGFILVMTSPTATHAIARAARVSGVDGKLSRKLKPKPRVKPKPKTKGAK